MATIPEICKPINLGSTAGVSFEETQRDFLWRRVLLASIIGLSISVIMFFFHRVIMGGESAAHPLPFNWLPALYFGHIVLFGLGVLTFYAGRARFSVRKLHWLALILVGLNVVLSVVTDTLHIPWFINFFTLSLLLFISAAIVPWPGRFQCTLGVSALVTFGAFQIWSYNYLPAVGDMWRNAGEIASFRQVLLIGLVAITVLAGAADVTSRTLYSLRRTAHRARRLGNYEIVRKLGEGGMGTVYLARHSIICRPTAVKVLAQEGASAGQALGRFEREVHLSASLTHPNTISIYDFGRTEEDVFYYAMEFLSGLDLRRLVQRFGPLCAERVAFLVEQICGSLHEAHVRGIVHRDIKPSNVFLTQRGGMYDFVKVLDFGLAKQTKTETASDITQSGAIFGTADYIAPEAAYGTETVDARADIYNLGGVIHWMLTGQPPFVSDSSLKVIVDHVKTDPTRPSMVSELPIPPEMDDVVVKCLAKRPEERFPSAEEVAIAIRKIPFGRPWNFALAKDWWELHGLIGDPDDEFDCNSEARTDGE